MKLKVHSLDNKEVGDIDLAGLISMGESWHNNHHAFPGSAKLGLFPGQADPGWWLIKSFEALGLARDIKLPRDLPAREELRWCGPSRFKESSGAALTPWPPSFSSSAST